MANSYNVGVIRLHLIRITHTRLNTSPRLCSTFSRMRRIMVITLLVLLVQVIL